MEVLESVTRIVLLLLVLSLLPWLESQNLGKPSESSIEKNDSAKMVMIIFFVHYIFEKK